MTFSGSTSFGGYTYQTDALYGTGLLPNTSIGINHNITVGINGANAVDGFVGVLTVRITQRPSQPSSVTPYFHDMSGLMLMLSDLQQHINPLLSYGCSLYYSHCSLSRSTTLYNSPCILLS
jgi:hypothetical protein